MSEFNRVSGSVGLEQELVELSGVYPVSDWDFNHWGHSDIDLGAYEHTNNLVREVEKKLLADGFAIVDFAFLLEEHDEAVVASAITIFLSGLGDPLRIFLNRPHWRKLRVDLSRSPERSEGAGQSPLHMDFVNAENPPDLVCLFCVTPDPLGGGASLLSEINGVEKLLADEHIDVLSNAQFSDGKVVNLGGIGVDINPFPVLSLSGKWRYRFTGGLLSNPKHEDFRDSLMELSQVLNDRTVTTILKRGELLIADQHKVLHGRGSLGEGQDKIAEDERRFLFHSFVRRRTGL
ncbi:MAG: hypothetical protein U5L04_03995 [Trueperaceae bacterium]|nr:hypothetical protein [Trueperaceae bacterium]